jgi:hypothetical protein
MPSWHPDGSALKIVRSPSPPESGPEPQDENAGPLSAMPEEARINFELAQMYFALAQRYFNAGKKEIGLV